MLIICVEYLYRFFVLLEPPCIVFNSVFALLIRVPYYVIGLFLSLHILIESKYKNRHKIMTIVYYFLRKLHCYWGYFFDNKR